MRPFTDDALLVQWQARKISWLFPLIVGVQTILSVAIIVGFGFLFAEVDEETALFLATGAPTLLLLVIGLVLMPQTVSESKNEGPTTGREHSPFLVWPSLPPIRRCGPWPCCPASSLRSSFARWHDDLALSVFSPVNFPAERLPGWLQAIHHILPITAMADVRRRTLARDDFELTATPFAVLAVWCDAGFTASYIAMNRRG